MVNREIKARKRAVKDFNIFYVSQGHEDLVTIKGELVKRKVRYIQIFNKTIERG